MSNAIDDLADQAAATRPEVFVLGRDFNDLCVEIKAQLAQAESGDQPSLFLHGSDLVVAGRGKLQPLDQALFTWELSSRIAFVRRKEGSKGGASTTVPADPPNSHIAALYSGRMELDLPQVDRITHAPFFGPDGVLQRTPGYHKAARVLYIAQPDLIIPHVSERPTPSEISAAYKLITEELIGDFRFAHDGDKAGALAAGLTPYIHPMIGGPTPIMGFDAPSNRAGKGLLMEALLAPACGGTWDTTPAPVRNEEWQKQIVASLKAGPLVAAFDNVDTKINSGALASFVTAWPLATSRILGMSANLRLPLPAVWAVTGKNLQASTENTERTYRIRVDPKSDSPGDRTGPEPGVRWRHPNLRGWFTAHRGEIIHSWLTLIQAWIADERPLVDVPAFGSFEQWTQIVGSILAFHGNHDLLTHREETREGMDNDKGAWRAFIDYWVRRAKEEETEAREAGKKIPPGAVTLRQSPTELVALAQSEDSHCPVNLSAPTPEGKCVAMGYELEKIRDQRFGDYILKKAKRSARGSGWYLEPVK